MEVVTLEEALTKSGIVRSRETALVIVTTIQSYRLRDEPGGEELAATRRIYRDNGYLQEAFQNLPAQVRAGLACDDNGLVNLSLANALRLRRPIVIMDEAHNARTPTSFESLARFGPKFVLELTATPEQRHDPQHPTDPRFASNVLHAVSALELKNEGMIKLPVDLESRGDWLEVLAATVQRRDELESIYDREHEDQGLPLLRPIALIQAQPSSKTRETHTVEKVKAALIEQLEVPAGVRADLHGHDRRDRRGGPAGGRLPGPLHCDRRQAAGRLGLPPGARAGVDRQRGDAHRGGAAHRPHPADARREPDAGAGPRSGVCFRLERRRGADGDAASRPHGADLRFRRPLGRRGPAGLRGDGARMAGTGADSLDRRTGDRGAAAGAWSRRPATTSLRTRWWSATCWTGTRCRRSARP